MIFSGYINPPTFDTVWIAKFANVPNLIFPYHLYFLIEGIPIEIIQDFEDIKFRWGVVDIFPVKPHDDIFRQDMRGFDVSNDDTKQLIYESIHFIRTYQPKSD